MAAENEYDRDSASGDTLLEAGRCDTPTSASVHDSTSDGDNTDSEGNEDTIPMCGYGENVDRSEEARIADQGSPPRLNDLHEGIFDDLAASVIDGEMIMRTQELWASEWPSGSTNTYRHQTSSRECDAAA